MGTGALLTVLGRKGLQGPGGHGEKQQGWADAGAGQVPATVSHVGNVGWNG